MKIFVRFASGRAVSGTVVDEADETTLRRCTEGTDHSTLGWWFPMRTDTDRLILVNLRHAETIEEITA